MTFQPRYVFQLHLDNSFSLYGWPETRPGELGHPQGPSLAAEDSWCSLSELGVDRQRFRTVWLPFWLIHSYLFIYILHWSKNTGEGASESLRDTRSHDNKISPPKYEVYHYAFMMKYTGKQHSCLFPFSFSLHSCSSKHRNSREGAKEGGAQEDTWLKHLGIIKIRVLGCVSVFLSLFLSSSLSPSASISGFLLKSITGIFLASNGKYGPHLICHRGQLCLLTEVRNCVCFVH